jgi:methylenetetrahydrofolate dehydrogenase (NADP+)/methenyltetrahydrofolate cyclohydrolase
MTDAPDQASAGPRLLLGAPIASEIRARVAADVEAFREEHGYAPALAVLVVGKDAPSAVYLHKILDGCRKVGIEDRLVELGDDATEADIGAALRALQADPRVAGIITQMPLPPGIPLTGVINVLDPLRDIDGIHPLNAGLLALGYDGFLPATAHAAVEILLRSGIPVSGRHAVVVGRSNVVGKPAALLLLRENATVTVCHTGTEDLPAVIRTADIVVVAIGKAGFVTGDMLKPGAVVVDIGINVVDGRLTGDVDFASAAPVASAITPVPGGVGPLTNAILLTHLVEAARNQARGLVPLGAHALAVAMPEARS